MGSSWVTFTAPALGRLLPIHCFIFQEAISKAVSSIALCTSSLHNNTFYLSFFRASIGQNCARVVVIKCLFLMLAPLAGQCHPAYVHSALCLDAFSLVTSYFSNLKIICCFGCLHEGFPSGCINMASSQAQPNATH